MEKAAFHRVLVIHELKSDIPHVSLVSEGLMSVSPESSVGDILEKIVMAAGWVGTICDLFQHRFPQLVAFVVVPLGDD